MHSCRAMAKKKVFDKTIYGVASWLCLATFFSLDLQWRLTFSDVETAVRRLWSLSPASSATV
jgi:hypothetical protein